MDHDRTHDEMATTHLANDEAGLAMDPQEPIPAPVGQGATRLGPPRFTKIFGVFAAACAFLAIASMIKPDNSRASDIVPSMEPVQSAPATNDQGWPLLGEIVGVETRVWIYGSPEGPRYTITTHDGWVMMQDLLADEVYRNFPDLDVENMLLEPAPSPLGEAYTYAGAA